jgi:hypothetical protein
LPVRVHDLFDVADAVEYVTQRRAIDPTIRVVNLALGVVAYYACSCDNYDPATQATAEAILNALAAGIVSFGATGNESQCGGIRTPACVWGCVRAAADYDGYYGTVIYYWPGGGVQCGDFSQPYWVTCFSNVTEDCDWFLAAPGYDVTVGGLRWDGTSPATAHCSGVAALMFSKAPCGMGAWTARQIIWSSALIWEWGWPYCPLPPEPRHLNAYYAVANTPAMPCVKADMNCDGLVGLADTDPFALVLTNPALYSQSYPNCNFMNGDINADGRVNPADIDPFAACLVRGGCP